MNQTPIRILLADDVAANRRAMKRLLSRRGCDITLVDNGQEAVEQFGDGAFDIVLLDLQMPVMDGYEAVRRIRESNDSRGRSIPIIAMSRAEPN